MAGFLDDGQQRRRHCVAPVRELDIVEMGSKAGIEQGLQQEKINCALHYADATEPTACLTPGPTRRLT